MEDYGPSDSRLQRQQGPEGLPAPATPHKRPQVAPQGLSYHGGPVRVPGAMDDAPRGTFVRWCDSEIAGDMVNLEHTWPEDFLTSQWPVPHKWYILYRAVAAAVLVCWVAGDMVYETRNFYSGDTWLWFIFATNWSFLFLALTAVVLAITCVLYQYKTYWVIDPIHIRTMPYSLKAQWLLYNISSCSALVVTTGYWGYVGLVSDSMLLTSHMSRLKHTANSIYVLVDLFISATPVRLQHMFFTIFMASLYIVFNALYYLSLGSVVIDNSGHTMGSRRGYYFMNWVDPVEAICTSVLGMLMAVVAQFLLHLVYLLRRWIHKKFLPYSNMAAQDSEMQNIISRSSTYNSMNEP